MGAVPDREHGRRGEREHRRRPPLRGTRHVPGRRPGVTENRFDVTTRVEDGRLLVMMTGDVNAGAASKMEELQNAVADTGLRGVVLDFGKVDYINSTGIALIVDRKSVV